VATAAKKGVGTWYFKGVDRALADIRVAWYYTWSAQPPGIVTPTGVEFVPMIWGPAAVTPTQLAQVRAAGSTVLGFNEPDRPDQANMPVAQALALWPQLMATGRRLGSPAPADRAATAGSWLDEFMTGARARGYQVDFIAVHWYGRDFGPGAVTQLHDYLQAVYERYGLPIWLTEYALIRFADANPSLATAQYPTTDEQVRFVAASTALLDSLPYVERYAWFALPSFAPDTGTGLYRPDSSLTAIGTTYRLNGNRK
jgi:hypothetical protein